VSINLKTLRTTAIILSMAAMTAFSADWPDWHGADRTNKSKETGLLKQWPEGGPKLLWTASGLGEGYSGVTTSDGIVYSAGVKDKTHYVFAFDRNGKQLWEAPAGKLWEPSRAFARAYMGSKATPTVSGGIVYYFSDVGYLVALDAKTGQRKWSRDVRTQYDAEVPEFAYSETPLVLGDRLFVAPYGKKATVICLDRNTGKVIWEAKPNAARAPKGEGGYASFTVADFGGFRQLVGFTSDHVYGIDSQTGNFLWTVPFRNGRGLSCTDAIFHNGHIFASTGYGHGSKLIRLSQSGRNISATTVYDTKLMDNHHGGVILHEGHLYGSGHEARGWFCLDLMTGQQKWNTPGKGAITFADGMLYIYDENGRMRLVKAAPDAFTEVSSFQVPEGGRGAYWAHPVISHGVLYLRHANNLYAYDVKNK
jgi:outer membrane protein assembly factor BamB